jgi:hypothetical protein
MACSRRITRQRPHDCSRSYCEARTREVGTHERLERVATHPADAGQVGGDVGSCSMHNVSHTLFVTQLDQLAFCGERDSHFPFHFFLWTTLQHANTTWLAQGASEIQAVIESHTGTASEDTETSSVDAGDPSVDGGDCCPSDASTSAHMSTIAPVGSYADNGRSKSMTPRVTKSQCQRGENMHASLAHSIGSHTHAPVEYGSIGTSVSRLEGARAKYTPRHEVEWTTGSTYLFTGVDMAEAVVPLLVPAECR